MNWRKVSGHSPRLLPLPRRGGAGEGWGEGYHFYPSYADCDGSGRLDFFDFLCFQTAFAAGDLSADCDDSGRLDFFDFLCFQSAFASGCR